MALFLVVLSTVSIVATSSSIENHPAAKETSVAVGSQNSAGSSEMAAAINALQSGNGPLGSDVNCSGGASGTAYCNTGLSASPSAASVVGSWTQLFRPALSARAVLSALTYDSADGYVVLFGGVTLIGSNQVSLGDTWKFSAGSWTNITTSASPSSRMGSSMVYDVADGYVLLFGGFHTTSATPTCATSGNLLRDTWKFVGGVWTNITLSQAPSPRALSSMVFDGAGADVVLFGGGTGTFTCFPSVSLGDTWKFVSGSWTNITSTGGPSARFGSSFAYDANDGYDVLFGGQVFVNGAFHDTWKLTGASWSNITTSSHPPARSLASMAYDPVDRYTLLFGGVDLSSTAAILGDSWTFQGGSWTKITAAGGPSARFLSSLAFDVADGYVVLFGGGGAAFLGDTWKFLSGVWTNITPTNNPSARVEAALAYDPADGYVVLFGGLPDATSTAVLGDTWTFLAGAWTHISTGSAPPASANVMMAYDTADGYLVLFTSGSTWKFSAGTWSMISTTNPPPRIAAGMIYDAVDSKLVLFGGYVFTTNGVAPAADTWEYNSGSWSNVTSSVHPSPRLWPAMAYDPTDGYAVLFGGVSTAPSVFPFTGTLGDTWKFVAGVWTNMTASVGASPPARTLAAITYDTADGYAILFGGVNGATGFLGDTWKFVGGSWMSISTTNSPSPRSNGSMTYDDADHYVILFGGTTSSVGVDETWKYAGGTWTNITPGSPVARGGASIAYDAADGYVVLFAGAADLNPIPKIFGDTWKFQNGIWTNITAASGPFATAYASMTYDAADGYVVLFEGGATWEFKAGVWTEITTLASPGIRPTASMIYDAADRYVVLFGGAEGYSSGIGRSDTWTYKTGVWTNITTTTRPSSRLFASMAYDAADGYAILFGGIDNFPINAPFGDTWKFSTGSWTNITSTTGPSPRFGASMEYDTQAGYTLFFGGVNTVTGFSGDTWEYLGGWTNITGAVSPSMRWNSAMAYDDANHYMLLFGGSESAMLGDTWKFSAPSPPAFDYSLSNNGPVNIVAGSSGTVTITTSLTSGTSQPVTPSCVTPLPTGITCTSFSPASVTPSSTGATSTLTISVASSAAVGSHSLQVTGSPLGATTTATTLSVIVSASGQWKNITPSSSPPARYTASMVYDAADGYVLLFGGQKTPNLAGVLADTWKFSGGIWTNITSEGHPSPRYEPSMVYDSADGYVILFGGSGGIGGTCCYPIGDTWKFLGGSWTNITPGVSPSPRDGVSMVNDPTHGYVILFGGGTGGASVLSDTWKFVGGSWTNITPSSSPSPRRGASMSYDAADGYVALFGGVSSSYTFVSDTWKFVGGSWTNITSNSGPSSRFFAPMAFDVADNYVILFGGQRSNGAMLGDTWKFVSGSWTNITAGSGPSPRFEGAMAYDIADSYVVLFGGQAVNGAPLDDTWKFSASSGPPPFDYSLFNNSPVTIPAGTSGTVSITASLTGGTALPVTLACAGLPAGITCGGFSPNPVTPTSGGAGSNFMINVGSSVATGTYTFTGTGSPAGATSSGASTTVTVVVPSSKDNTLTSVGNVSCTIQSGANSCNAAVTVIVTDTTAMSNVPSGTVTFTFMAGTTGGSLSSGSCILTAGTCSVTFTGAMAGTGSISAQYTGDSSHSSSTSNVLIIHVTVATVPFAYALSVNPTSASIVVGGSRSATVTATLTSGTAQPITLYLAAVSPSPTVCMGSSQPCGTTTFAPLTITPSSTGATSTMTISTTNLVPPGTYTLTIAGSPAGASSSSATFTLTITAPSVSTVRCGHNESCGVVSNATLSNVKIAGNTLHIEADGTQGAHGYANVTVPKSEIPNIDDMHVFVDNSKLNSGVTVTSNSTAYFIYFTFTFHSPVKIDIQLSAPQQTPTAPTILGIDQTLFYEIIGGIIGAIVIVSAFVVVARRRKTKPAA